ncbi:unnamed protein product [Withania somnifera]
MDEQQSPPPHVLIFPLPLQGPVNSMFKLAQLLCLSGLHITFLLTENVHSRLLLHTDIASRFDQFPGLQIKTISDGLPDDHPREGSKFMEMIIWMNQLGVFPEPNRFSGDVRSGDLTDSNIQLFKTELDAPILNQMRTICPNLYPIGPLHATLKNKLAKEKKSLQSSSNSLWPENRSCIDWLNNQLPDSVVYVSFGSIATLSNEQLMEFWYGLVNSGQRFLWVIRPDSIAGEEWKSKIPADLAVGTKERGYIVGWAPQEEVLADFGLIGKPMICWPYFFDQQTNSRFVEAVWGLGLDMKDTCDRELVEKMVKDLMIVRKEEFLERANQMSKLAENCLMEGGSSYCNLELLVKDIKFLSNKINYY